MGGGGITPPNVIPPTPETPEEAPKPKPPATDSNQNQSTPSTSSNPFSDTFLNAMSVNVGNIKKLYLANFNSINKRLGELRGSLNEHGVWGRTFVGGYSGQTFWTLQAGYDNLILPTQDFNLYVGSAVSYSKDPITDMGEFMFYTSLIQDQGWYNDAIFKISVMGSKTPLEKLTHYAITLSDEVGYRFVFDQFFLDPQAEFSLGYLTGGDYRSVHNGNVVKIGFGDSVHFRTRLGASAGYNHTFDNQYKLQPYLGLFVEVDCFTQSSAQALAQVGAYGRSQEIIGSYTNDERMVLNLGMNADLLDYGKLYFDFEKSFLGDFNIDWKINVGFRYAFGDVKGFKVSEAIKTDDQKDSKPLKLKEKDKSSDQKEQKKGEEKKEEKNTENKTQQKK